MKKTKLLALTLVVAIMLTGAGYAIWSDQLVVESTVNTGFLDVDFTDVKRAKLFGFEISDPEGVVVTHPIVTDGVNTYGDHKSAGSGDMANNDKVEFTISNFYPGATVTRVITVKNTGEVPVKIKKDDFKFINLNIVPNKSLAEAEEDISIDVVPTDEDELNVVDKNWGGGGFYTLDKGDTKSFTISFIFNPLSDNETEHQNYEYLMELNFDQKI